jgi:hypothetical protein
VATNIHLDQRLISVEYLVVNEKEAKNDLVGNAKASKSDLDGNAKATKSDLTGNEKGSLE